MTAHAATIATNVASEVLAATAEPEEYAERITALLSSHYRYGRDKMLALARRTATTHQREALADADGEAANRNADGTEVYGLMNQKAL